MFLLVFVFVLVVALVAYWFTINYILKPKGATNAHKSKKWKLHEPKPINKPITNLINQNETTFWLSHGQNGVISLINENGFPTQPDIKLVTSKLTKGKPNGLCLNSEKKGFEISDDGVLEPADLICVSEDGLIAGYQSSVSPTSLITMVDASDLRKSFKHCCIVNQKLYVTEFSQGKIEVYNDTFDLMDSFTDVQLQSQGFQPDLVVTDNTFLYVSFVKESSGCIVQFGVDGKLVSKLIVDLSNIDFLLLDSESILLIQDHKIQRFNKDTGAKDVTFRNEKNGYLEVESGKGLCFGHNKLIVAQDSSLSLLDPL